MVSTPFFPPLAPLLFGQPPRSSLAQYQSLLPKVDSLSALREAFGSLCPDTLLSPLSEGRASRQRLFSPLMTFWAFLSQVLSPDSTCRDAVRRAQAWWMLHHQIKISAHSSAYCQARLRLPLPMLERIHRHVCDRLEANVPSARLWRGHAVKIVDGTGLSMPDTLSNQNAFPQSSTQLPGCGFPHLKLVGLFSLASGALLHSVSGTFHIHENQLFVKLWPHLHKGDVVLADRAFCSYLALGSLLAQGVDCVMRLHGKRGVDFRRGQRLGKDDQLVLWQRSAPRPMEHHPEKLAALPPTLRLRQIRFKVQDKGFRTRSIVLVTTLLDPVRYPAQAIAQLYAQRWSVELHFRELKSLLALDVLRCLSEPMIQKELLLHIIAYNLVRSVMQTAALRHHLDLDRLSFKGALDTLNHFASAVHAAHGKPRTQARLLDEMFESIAKDLIPLRPGRSEPRARKRRPKYFPGLTKPRRKTTLTKQNAHPKSALS
jgi:Transposase DDE domain